MAEQVHEMFDTVLILDFGSQYSHLIVRRIREFGVYCELLPCTQKISELGWKPVGVILAGSPFSVYDHDAPRVDPDVFNLGVPVMGICYGLQEMTNYFGGKVQPCAHREYGPAVVKILPAGEADAQSSMLFEELSSESKVWMSHGDQVTELAPGFRCIATTDTAPFAAVRHVEKPLFGVQFHPEVTHSIDGKQIIKNFVVKICGAKQSWTMTNFIDKEVERIRAMVGPKAQVIGAVSGGVDSSVAAKLMHMAIGDRFHGILVDNGVMRMNECEQAHKMLVEKMGINLKIADASDRFLANLAGVTDPEKKRKIIGNTFIDVFEEEAKRIDDECAASGTPPIEFLLQGTLYPDVIESISFKGPSATIKTHHNVGGLKENMKLKLIEPLRELFKDEVRELGRLLGMDDDLVWRHPFPGPGIAIRILGEVTKDQVRIARHADFIYIEEIKKAGLYRKIAQAYAAVLPVKAVGVKGDKRTYEQMICLRAVETSDFMTADWYPFPYDVLKRISTRICNEVDGVNRVVYDVSSKPPATIELE
ncbi:GMP synthase (glutamine-hydrolyzing) [Actinomortierella wolfii]|nr:GMP synthase (glutamine-hydrolyzing) [Actinomortierella wolfii]KAG0240066.1 GMP synthase (glutamine-hydrolyzing) [Actinomortierella wolfii]